MKNLKNLKIWETSEHKSENIWKQSEETNGNKINSEQIGRNKYERKLWNKMNNSEQIWTNSEKTENSEEKNW